MKASSYLLGMAYSALIHNPGTSLYARMNLISIMFNLIKANLGYRDKVKDEIEELDRKIKLLKENYEFSLEKSDYAFEKRAVFEAKLDEILLDITILSERYELLDASMISEVQATRWRA